MTQSIDFNGFCKMLRGGVQIVKENHEYLSKLDAVIGDGDHGVTLLRAWEKLESIMDGFKGETLSDMLDEMSWALLGIDGGATGPLYGLMFMGFSAALKGKANIDAPTVLAMFEAALKSLQSQSKAQVGDKTMMDALIPAIEAMRETAVEGAALEDVFDAAAARAMAGAEATANMVARVGRAKNMGERTLGHQDPGATSMALVFKGLRAGL